MFSSRCLAVVLLIIAAICFSVLNDAIAEVTTMFASDVYTQDVIGGDVFFEIIDPIELEYTYRLRPARDFGAPFNSSFKVKGAALVPALPSDACSSLDNAYDMRGSVALIERGECSFLTKTLVAQEAGARAAIITESNINSNEYDYYIEMVHDNTDREANIPAGFLLGKNGRVIRTTLRKLKKKHAVINLPVNLTFTPAHLINHPPWLGW